MRRMLMVGICLALALPAHAQQQPQSPPTELRQDAYIPGSVGADGIRNEETLIVTGDQPGPGLWLVRKGNHDLWILGTLKPLPAKMQWQSKQVEDVIANAQEVIRSPGISMGAKGGFFTALTLLPSLLGVRKSPGGKTLEQAVSPQSYARWKVLKAHYIGSDRGIEQWRPMFAALKLYDEAMKKSGLESGKSVLTTINKAIEVHHPSVTVVNEAIVVTDPKAAIKEFKRSTLDDLACFDNTMTRIETDLDSMRLRANAWATGDVAALQSLPPPYQWEACSGAITEAGLGKRLGLGDAQKNLRAKWMAAAEAALDKNTVTFAMLSISEMLGAEGYLAKLKAKGYTVLAPDE